LDLNNLIGSLGRKIPQAERHAYGRTCQAFRIAGSENKLTFPSGCEARQGDAAKRPLAD